MKKEKGKILIAGGTGLVGTILKEFLNKNEKEVYILTRRPSESATFIRWSPTDDFMDDAIQAHEFEAVINASGANIAEKKWTNSRKKELYDSRLTPTRFLWSHIKKNHIKTKKFIQISATGIYGQRAEPVNERDSWGDPDDFMVQLTKEWEKTFLEHSMNNVTSCIVRLGVVISEKGGFLDRFLDPLRFYISPYFGDGKNYISWINDTDLATVMLQLIDKKNVETVYNLTTPHPFTSGNLSKELQKVFQPRALRISIPRWVVKLIFGEMSTAILSNAQIMPSNLKAMGYKYEAPLLSDALQQVKSELKEKTTDQ